MASTYPTSLDVFTNPLTTNPLTAPSHAQQHSDINDAVEALEAKVAIGATVLGTYTAYTPTFTNFTLGDGTATSAYCRVNNFVHFYGTMTWGTTTAFTAGNMGIGYPIQPFITLSSPFISTSVGTTYFKDISLGTYFGGLAMQGGTFSVFLPGVQGVAGSFSQFNSPASTVPFTWATGDAITWNILYRSI